MHLEVIKFTSKSEKGEFYRRLRLLAEDVLELADLIGLTSSAQSRQNDEVLVALLDRHRRAWATLLSATNSSLFVVMARIHDTRTDGYFIKLMKFLDSYKALKDLRQRFRAIETTHRDLIRQVLKLRHNVVAHAGFDRPVHEVFGFQHITAAQFEAYWSDMAGATSDLENRALGPGGGPKINVSALSMARTSADRFFDAVKSESL
jgi:hypothetical protein